MLNDPRGKVKFARSGTSLSILTNGVDYSDFSSLEIEIKSIDERLGIASDLKRCEFNGMPAMERDFVIQGSRIWMIDFLIGNVSHNLMYTAPRSRFGTELDRVKASLSTYQPLTREMTEEEVLEHYLAKARRLGRLFIDMGRYEEADFYVGDGLEHHDSDPVLLELRAEIEERRGIARR